VGIPDALNLRGQRVVGPDEVRELVEDDDRVLSTQCSQERLPIALNVFKQREGFAGGPDEIGELDLGRFLGRLPVDGVVDVGRRLTNESAFPESAPTVDDEEFGGLALERRPECIEFVCAIDEPVPCHTRSSGRVGIILTII